MPLSFWTKLRSQIIKVRSDSLRKAREKRRRLELETLEQRWVLTTYNWVGLGASANWNAASNWEIGSATTSSFPNSANDVADFFSAGLNYPVAGVTVTVPAATTFAVGEIESASTQKITISPGNATTSILLVEGPGSTPGIIMNDSIASQAGITLSTAISAPAGLNINFNSGAAATISGGITATGALNITGSTTAASTVSGSVLAAGGINILLNTGSTGSLTLSAAVSGSTTTTATTINATLNAGELIQNSASDNISSNSLYTVNGSATLAIAAVQGEIGAGSTVVLNNGATFRSNNTNGVTLANNFILPASGLVTFNANPLTLTNSTINLNGADTIAFSLDTITTFSSIFIGNPTASVNSLAFTGTAGNGSVGFLGNSTFAGSTPISFLGSDTLRLTGSNTVTVNTPTLIQTVLGGTGSLVLAGNSPLTLTGHDTYTGGTSIPLNTLLVDSPGSLSSATTVSTAGTLGGTGTVGAIVAISGGMVIPGDPSLTSGNILTATSANFKNGGVLVINIAALSTPGTDFNQLNLNAGNLTVDGTSTITINLLNLNSTGTTSPGGILHAGSVSGTFSLANENLLNNTNNYSVLLDATETPGQLNADISTNPQFANPASATFTVNSSGSVSVTAAPGDGAVTFTDLDTDQQGGVGLPSGVTFTDATGLLSGTPALGTVGVYTDTFTAKDGSGNQTTQTFTLNVVGEPTTTALVDQGPTNPSDFGSPVTFQATIKAGGQNVSITPGSETVAFVNATSGGNVTIGTAPIDSSGFTATFTLSTLPVGSDSIFAVYPGDNLSYLASPQSNQVIQSVLSNTGSITTITSNLPNPVSILSDTVTFAVHVATNSPATGDTVTLEDASNSSITVGAPGLLNSSGNVTISVVGLTAGSHSIFAVYTPSSSDSASNNGSLSPDVVENVQGTTTTTLTNVGSAQVLDSGAATFSVSVAGGATLATGTVTLEDASNGNAVVGSGTLTGSATATVVVTNTTGVTNLLVGSHNIFAVYGSDSTHLGGQSNTTTLTVNPSTYEWVPGGDSVWTTPKNWEVGSVTQTVNYPSQGGDTAAFISATGKIAAAVVASVPTATNITVGEIEVGSTELVTITAINTGSLTLQGVGGTPGVLNNDSTTTKNSTISIPITAPNGLSITNLSNGGTMQYTAPISVTTGDLNIMDGALASANTTITGLLSAANNVNIVNSSKSALNITGGITAGNSLNISRTGTTGFTISGGTVAIGSATAAGTLSFTDTDSVGNTITFSAPISAPGSLNINIAESGVGAADVIKMAGGITVGTLGNTTSSLNINFSDSITNNGIQITGPITVPGSVSITYQSGTISADIISGAMQTSALNVTQQGTAAQTLTSAITPPSSSTITAVPVNVTITAGEVLFGNSASLIDGTKSIFAVGGNSTLGDAGGSQADFSQGSTITFGNGSGFLSNNAAGVTLANDFILASGASITVAGGVNPLNLSNSTINLSGSNAITLSNASTTFSSIFSSVGSSTLNLTGSNTATVLGNTTFQGGPITLLGNDTLNLIGATTLQINNPTIIQNAIVGIGPLTVMGVTSPLTLSGADTFTGGTNIQGGELLVDSPGSLSLNPTDIVTVNGSSTLGGTGSVGPIAAPGGTVIPGDPSITGGIGTLTAPSADFTIGAGSSSGTLILRLVGFSAPGASTGYDQLNLGTGLLNLDSGSLLTLDVGNVTVGGAAIGAIVDGPGSSTFVPGNVTVKNDVKGFPVQLDYSSPGVNIDVLSNPAFTSLNNTTFQVNSSSTFTVTAGGFPNPTITEVGNLPGGVSFTTGGVLTGIPNPGTAGSYPLTFTANNNGSATPTQSFTLVVQAVPTTTALFDLGGSTTPSFFSTPVNFTAAVTASSSVLGDTVSLFYDLGSGSSSPVSGGTFTLSSSGAASFAVTSLAVGTDSIFAVYSGDATFASSKSPDVVQQVQSAGTTSTVLTDLGPIPSLASGSVSFSTAVTAFFPVTGDSIVLEDASNGNVTVGAGTLNASGMATITVSPNTLSASSHSIFAVFNPSGTDLQNNTSQSTAIVQQVESATTTTLTDNSPNPSLLGQAVNFTINVNGGTAISNDTVTLVDVNGSSTTTLGSASLSSGSATIAAPATLAVGSHSIFAVYSNVGDATHAPSKSAQIVQNVVGIESFMVALNPTESTSQFAVTWEGQAGTNWSVTNYNIMVSKDFGLYTPLPGITNPTTLTTTVFTGANNHTYSFFVVANGKDSSNNPQSSLGSATVTTTVHSVIPTDLTVSSLTPTATGFTATFSEPFLNIPSNPVHLYNAIASNANYGPPDVTLVGSKTGTITGSLVINSTNTGFTFIRTNLATGGGTGGLLPPDQYTVTFLSGPLGFQDTNGGLLDGNSSGIPGTNYTATFAVTAQPASAVTVSIPDFARGPDGNAADSINLVNAQPSPLKGGIPVTLNIPSSDSVTSATITLQYDVLQLGSATAGVPIQTAFPNANLTGASFTVTSSTVALGTGPTVAIGATGAVDNTVAGNSTATITIAQSENFIPGETVTITGVGSSTAGFNGQFIVLSDPTPTSFTFIPSSAITGLSEGTGAASATVTATTAGTQTFFVGEVVAISNANVPGYNGQDTITAAGGTTFSFINATAGLGAATVGTVTALNLATSGGGTVSSMRPIATTVLTFNSPTPLPTGNVVLGGLVAYVPAAAPYLSKEQVQIVSSFINTGSASIATVNDNALQVVAFEGNTSGTGSYSALDSGLLLNVSSGADAGFADFPTLDPAILGDLNSSGSVDPSDAVQMNTRNALGSNAAFVPAFPGKPSNVQAGPDPTLSIPSVFTVSAAGTVQVPVDIDDAKPAGSMGMKVATLALRYDPSEFSVSPQDVQLGSVPLSGSGWLLQTVVDQATGEIGITLSSRTALADSVGGSLAVITLHEKSTAALSGVSPLELVASVTANGQPFSTSVDDAQGPFTLTPAPTNSSPVPGLAGNVTLQASLLDTVAPIGASSGEQADLLTASPLAGGVGVTSEAASAAMSVETASSVVEESVVHDSVVVESQQPDLATALSTTPGEAPPVKAVAVLTTPSSVVLLDKGALQFSSNEAAQASGPFLASLPPSSNAGTQRAQDQVFQALNGVEAVPPSAQSANTGKSSGMSELLRRVDATTPADWLQGSADPVLPDGSDAPGVTDLDTLDGYFALVGEADAANAD